MHHTTPQKTTMERNQPQTSRKWPNMWPKAPGTTDTTILALPDKQKNPRTPVKHTQKKKKKSLQTFPVRHTQQNVSKRNVAAQTYIIYISEGKGIHTTKKILTVSPIEEIFNYTFFFFLLASYSECGLNINNLTD